MNQTHGSEATPRQAVLVDPLRALRHRLTLWYAATLFVILAIIGVGLFLAVRSQYAQQLDRSLGLAVDEIERAARIREMEAASAHGMVVDAVEELRIPDRTLYLFSATGDPVVPDSAPSWMRTLVLDTRGDTVATGIHHVAPELTLRYRVERIHLASGAAMVAVAVADEIELEDRYAFLITVFGVASAVALLLVAGGSWFLVQKATAPAEHAMKRMRQFMGDAAHELRTPLTVLRTRAEVTVQQPRDMNTYVSALQAIDAEAVRLGRMVDDLLLLARVDAGERAVEHSRVSLDDLVMDAADSSLPMATARGLSVRIEEFEEARVDGDPRLLRQLVMILLHNAIKFTPEGGVVQLKVGTVDGTAFLEVADNGVGINSTDMPRLFERFFRGDVSHARTGMNAVQPAVEGAGLGLSIAQWIADAHHATITVSSVPGQGAHFLVRFNAPLSTPAVS